MIGILQSKIQKHVHDVRDMIGINHQTTKMKNNKNSILLDDKTPTSHNGIDATNSNNDQRILKLKIKREASFCSSSSSSSLPECAFKFCYFRPNSKTDENYAEVLVEEIKNG